MKIFLQNSPVVCDAAAGETILSACARKGVILSAPCGGRQRCGKCKVQILKGQISGDTPDAEGWALACLAVPVSDITIVCSAGGALTINEVLTADVKNRSGTARTGVAIDIGTTTVSARLVDLDTSLVLDTISELNDQRVLGADVMSRIDAAKKGKTEELFTLINHQTERILMSFVKRQDIQKIENLVVSGNTVMLHLFLNINPSSMGEIPFTPVFLEEKKLKGKTLSLSAETITILPSIAAFLGGDITAGLTVLDIMNIPGPSLFIDIGTNSEMALCNQEAIFCCATAAGPAFEGAEISCGVGGINGAISKVEFAAGKPVVTTVGNIPPVGICGSGLIDVMAVMLKQGIIDKTGFMTASEQGFYLAPGLFITGRDIRQFQLAKSAILSGIKILCKSGGLNVKDIKNVFVAGGFGFYINKQNAVETGIFPEEFLNLLSVCGNVSLEGALECLTTKNFVDRCKQIIDHCSVIDLTADPFFMDEFAENMLFK